MHTPNTLRRDIKRHTHFHWIFLIVILLHGAPLSAALPGQQLEDSVMRLLEKDPRGKVGDLTTSQAVLYLYDHLEPVFRQALQEVEEARRDADRYQRRMPRTNAEWGQYIDALSRMQTARERYQEALRNLIAERQPLIERMLGPQGLIRGRYSEIGRVDAEQTAELAAVAEVQRQILQQEAKIRDGNTPDIRWPAGIDPVFKEEITNAVRSAAQPRGDSYAAWRALDRRLGRLRRDLQAAADEVRGAANANWAYLDDMEKRAFAEINVLIEAQIDLASNAILQQTTIRRVYMAKQTYSVWKELY